MSRRRRAPIAFGLVGTGGIASTHARAIAAARGATLRAVCTRDPARARAFADTFGGEPMSSLDALLARPDIDVVCIATPSGSHGSVALRSLAAGKHVLCEKPLEINTARIDAMIRAARRSGRILAGVYQQRFGDGARRLKRAVEQGRFGRLALCSAYIKWWRDPSYYAGSSWRGTLGLDGGGALINQGIHAVDMLQWFAGPPASVRAAARTQVHTMEAEDTLAAVLRFPHGALGVIEAATSCHPGQQMRVELCGEHGTAVLENDRLIRWEFARPLAGDKAIRRDAETRIGGGASDPKAIGILGHRLLVEDFVRSVRTGGTPLVPPEEARKAVALVQAIYRSARTDRAVRLARS